MIRPDIWIILSIGTAPKTDYKYDFDGRLLSLVRAAGTSSQISSRNDWDPDSPTSLKQTTYSDSKGIDFKKVAYQYHSSGSLYGMLSSEVWTDIRTGATQNLSYAYTTANSGVIASKTVTRSLPGTDAVTVIAYNAFGNISAVTDAMGHRTKASLAPGACVTSDGLGCFAVVTDAGCLHMPTVVGARRPRDLPAFKWINTVLGNLKTTLAGTFHALKFSKYGSDYLGAFAYRFNRRFDLRGLVARSIVDVARRPPLTRKTVKMGHPETRY